MKPLPLSLLAVLSCVPAYSADPAVPATTHPDTTLITNRAAQIPFLDEPAPDRRALEVELAAVQARQAELEARRRALSAQRDAALKRKHELTEALKSKLPAESAPKQKQP